MGIIAKTKQSKTSTLQEEVRKIPTGDAKLTAGAWIYARLGACTPEMSSASTNFCSEQCEALLRLFWCESRGNRKYVLKKSVM